MRSVSNAFLDFQLTALFDKIMPVDVRSTAIAPARLAETAISFMPRCLTAARYLFAQAKAFDQRPIAIGAAALQIIQQLAATAHHTQQAAA